MKVCLIYLPLSIYEMYPLTRRVGRMNLQRTSRKWETLESEIEPEDDIGIMMTFIFFFQYNNVKNSKFFLRFYLLKGWPALTKDEESLGYVCVDWVNERDARVF